MIRKLNSWKWRNLLLALLLSLVACAIAAPKSIDADEGREKVAHGAVLVDVRTADEFRAGHVPGARNIPHSEVEQRLAEFGSDRKREIVLYCGSGRRAGLAQEILRAHGYTNVFNAGAYSAWISPQSKS